MVFEQKRKHIFFDIGLEIVRNKVFASCVIGYKITAGDCLNLDGEIIFSKFIIFIPSIIF